MNMFINFFYESSCIDKVMIIITLVVSILTLGGFHGY